MTKAMFNFSDLNKRLNEAQPDVVELKKDLVDGIPDRCVEILHRCLDLAPEKRPSPNEVAAVFHEAYDQSRVQSRGTNMISEGGEEEE